VQRPVVVEVEAAADVDSCWRGIEPMVCYKKLSGT